MCILQVGALSVCSRSFEKPVRVIFLSVVCVVFRLELEVYGEMGRVVQRHHLQSLHDVCVVLGWSWRCLEKWGEFFSVTTYSLCMTFVLWICTEVGTFLGGLLSTKELSAFSISFQVEGFAWMVIAEVTAQILHECITYKCTLVVFPQ